MRAHCSWAQGLRSLAADSHPWGQCPLFTRRLHANAGLGWVSATRGIWSPCWRTHRSHARKAAAHDDNVLLGRLMKVWVSLPCGLSAGGVGKG